MKNEQNEQNEQSGRILHHSLAIELTDEMIAKVSGGWEHTQIQWSTESTFECKVDAGSDAG